MAGSSTFLFSRALIVAIALVLVAQAPGFGQTDPALPAQQGPDRPEHARFHDETVDELQKRSKDMGPDFAGSWIDPADRGHVFLGFKGKAGKDKARVNGALSKFANDSRVTFVETKFSQLEQVAAIERATAKVTELLADPATGLWPFLVRDNTPENAVDVVIDHSVADRRDEVEQALSDDIRSGLVRVTTGDAAIKERANVCASRDQCNPMRGGLGINGANCTSSFVFRNNLGTRFMSTAGHCGFGSMTHGGQTLGPRVWSQSLGSVDAAIYDITNSNQAQPNNSTYRLPSGSNFTDSRVNSKIGAPNSMLVGHNVCAHAYNGERCAQITAWNASGAGNTDQGEAQSMYTCAGDSGAPIAGLTDVKAYGIFQASGGDVCGTPSLWSWTSTVEATSGYTLVIHRATKRLKGNQGLRGRYQDQRIDSPSLTYTAVMQGDGNFVLYLDGGGSIWSSGTNGNTNGYLVMQSDGNLVIKNASGVVQCDTRTHNNPGAYLEAFEDGKLRIRTAGGSTLWTNGTCYQ